jgi:DNA-directed RNA polymerase specialized sigma24 family protein
MERRRHVVPHATPGRPEKFVFYEDELDGLPEREQTVLRLRAGLGGAKSQTFKEIGRLLGISPERVRQIQAAALLKCQRQRQPQACGPDDLSARASSDELEPRSFR